MSRVLIIAEAGVNHNGNLELAKRMAVVAKEAGADIVKYQTAVPELVMSASAPKAEYQIQNTGAAESQLEMARKIHLPLSDYAGLKKYCEEEVGIKFLSTPFDHESIDLLRSIGMDIWKIPSGEITNKPYLEKIGAFGQDVILSTGMSEMWEIVRAVDTLVSAGTQKERISILHCTSDYPAKMQDLNLRAMNTIAAETGCRVGYSDHSEGTAASIAAVAMGAEIIEKHFTLDHNMEGPDHIASLEPQELLGLVQQIRNVELAMGDGIKTAIGGEIPTRVIARRSIHARHFIPAGTVISSEDLIMKRPGSGISPFDESLIVGKRTLIDILADSMLELNQLQ